MIIILLLFVNPLEKLLAIHACHASAGLMGYLLVFNFHKTP